MLIKWDSDFGLKTRGAAGPRLRPAAAHLVLFDLMLDVLQVGPQRLRTHPLNPCLRHIQPVRELLQLLVLQVHEDLVESGSERQLIYILIFNSLQSQTQCFSEARTRPHNFALESTRSSQPIVVEVIKFAVMSVIVPLTITRRRRRFWCWERWTPSVIL